MSPSCILEDPSSNHITSTKDGRPHCGDLVGDCEGDAEGLFVGAWVGDLVIVAVGLPVGEPVRSAVGEFVPQIAGLCVMFLRNVTYLSVYTDESRILSAVFTDPQFDVLRKNGVPVLVAAASVVPL